MTVDQLLRLLEANENATLHFMLPSGEFFPDHFHITEVGRVDKHFIDCGGTRRQDAACLLQAWSADDLEHRILAGKLARILQLAEPILQSGELSVQVEYGETVATQYLLAKGEVTPGGLLFSLVGKQTDCLAKDKCGVGECGTADCC